VQGVSVQAPKKYLGEIFGVRGERYGICTGKFLSVKPISTGRFIGIKRLTRGQYIDIIVLERPLRGFKRLAAVSAYTDAALLLT